MDRLSCVHSNRNPSLMLRLSLLGCLVAGLFLTPVQAQSAPAAAPAGGQVHGTTA